MYTKEVYVKLYAFNKLMEHLKRASVDARKRERERSKVALNTISKWLAEGEMSYDRKRRFKST